MIKAINKTVKNWITISVIWFSIAGFIGLFLRMLFFFPIGNINYKFMLHGHSHIIFLGWVFNVIYSAYVLVFIPHKNSLIKKYKILFWLFQFSLIGMSISFPIQGYALYSITFSTIHVFLTYYFIYIFFNDLKKHTKFKGSYSVKFAKISLIFFAISSIGPFALGGIMAKGLGASNLYYLAIYFYLHFQYNGLFTFAIFSLFLYLLDYYEIKLPSKKIKSILWLLITSCLISYSLSTLWTKPNIIVYIIGFISSIIQLFAAYLIIKILIPIYSKLKIKLNKTVLLFFIISFIAFILKLILQFASSFPVISQIAFEVKNLVIAYLHLVFLGFVSPFLLGWLKQIGLFRINKTGILLYLLGFIGSEILIVLPFILINLGLELIPNYYQILFGVSFLIPVSIILFLIDSIKTSGS